MFSAKFFRGLGVAFIDSALAALVAGAAGVASGVKLPLPVLGSVAIAGGLKGVFRYLQDSNSETSIVSLPSDLSKK